MKLLRFLSVFASLLIVMLAATVALASTTTITFAPAGTPGYDSGGAGADQVILADFNRDGILDMVVCNTNGYSVFLGNGDGTFNFSNTYPTAGTGANLCAVADFNGDGFLDIAATTNLNANQTGGGVDVLLGNGDGTFQAPISDWAEGFETFGIAVGDINKDGIPDLVVTSNCQVQTCLNGSVTVLLGKGDGTFQYPIIVNATLGGPVALADMNGDGNLDIIYNGGVLLGDGTDDGIFTAVSGGELLGGAAAIAIADVNGDGKLDVVEATDENKVAVLLGNGDGTLQLYANYKTGEYWPLAVTVANNLDGAGLPDIVVSNECQFTQKGTGKGRCNTIGSVSVLTDKIGGSFAGFNASRNIPLVPPSAGYEASSAAVADVNGDGKPDLVISYICTTPNLNNPCTSDGWVEVLLNTTSFTTTTVLTSAPNPSTINQSVLLTATVTSTGGVISNGDTVTFSAGGSVIGTGTTTNGVATLPWVFTSGGTKSLVAAYGGDTWNAPSSSAVLKQVVNLYPSTTTVISAPNPSTYPAQVMFTATVTSAEVGGPTGTVTFKNGATSLGQGTLNLGVATFTTPHNKPLPVGTLTITATYNGDSQTAKSSGTTTQTVY